MPGRHVPASKGHIARVRRVCERRAPTTQTECTHRFSKGAWARTQARAAPPVRTPCVPRGPAQEAEFYRVVQEDGRRALEESSRNGGKEQYVNMLYSLLKMRQACNHPWLVKGMGQKCVHMPTSRPPHTHTHWARLPARMPLRSLCPPSHSPPSPSQTPAGTTPQPAPPRPRSSPPQPRCRPRSARGCWAWCRRRARSAPCAATCLRTPWRRCAATCTASSARQRSWRAQVRGGGGGSIGKGGLRGAAAVVCASAASRGRCAQAAAAGGHGLRGGSQRRSMCCVQLGWVSSLQARACVRWLSGAVLCVLRRPRG